MNRNPDESGCEVLEAERRRRPRIPTDHLQDLRACGPGIESPHTLRAKLVDVSDGGVGVEMAAPLAVGSVVSIAGELHSTRFCVGLQGRVRVAHCRRRDDGLFRVGLAFEGARCRNIHCAHELGAARESLAAGAESIPAIALDGNGSRKTFIPNQLWGDLRVTLPAVAPERDG